MRIGAGSIGSNTSFVRDAGEREHDIRAGHDMDTAEFAPDGGALGSDFGEKWSGPHLAR